MPISTNIKMLRDHFEITQNELASVSGVTDGAVSTWESGKSQPRISVLKKIADHYSMAVSDLIEDDGFKNIVNAQYGLINGRVSGMKKQQKTGDATAAPRAALAALDEQLASDLSLIVTALICSVTGDRLPRGMAKDAAALARALALDSGGAEAQAYVDGVLAR